MTESTSPLPIEQTYYYHFVFLILNIDLLCRHNMLKGWEANAEKSLKETN